MATLSRRHHHVVRAVVSAVSNFGRADGGNNQGERVVHQLQLHLAMGPDLRSRTRQTVRKHLKPTNKSWRVDETYVKVKGQERFLYRAVDSRGQTVDFLLTAKRDTAAAKRFFQRGLANPGNVMPRVINVDKNRAYPAAVNALKKDGTIRPRCRVRQCKYLNNVVEQDHRNVKTTNLAGQGLRVSGDGVADAARHRGDGHDQERESEESGEGRRDRPSEIHRQIVRHRCVIGTTKQTFLGSLSFRNGILSAAVFIY